MMLMSRTFLVPAICDPKLCCYTSDRMICDSLDTFELYSKPYEIKLKYENKEYEKEKIGLKKRTLQILEDVFVWLPSINS